jgi:hypothetical protein
MSAGEHAHGEEFPREETAALVGAVLESERRRWKIQVVLVSLGVTALVLGLPTRSLFGYRMLEVWPTERGEWTGLHLLPALVARAITELTHWRAYQAWYLVSALAAGGTTAMLLSMAHRRGMAPLRAICLALVTIAIPMAWLAATIPSASSCEMLGAVLLFDALDKEYDPRWTGRASASWFLAALLHAWNAYLWPAFALALVMRRRSNALIAVGALGAWIAVVTGAWWLEHGSAEWSSWSSTSWRTMLASGSGGYGQLLAWSLGLVVMMGVGAIGIVRFAYVSLHQRARRPAAWTFAFGLVPLVVLGLGGDIAFGVPWLWLVPIAFVGLLDLERVRLWLLGAVALVGVVAVRTFDPGAPEDDWYNLVVFRVRPSDLVIAADGQQHEKVLSALTLDVIAGPELDRPNVEYDIGPAKSLTDRIEAARSAHRRIVLDVREPTRSHLDWIRLPGPNFQRLRDQGAIDLDVLLP